MIAFSKIIRFLITIITKHLFIEVLNFMKSHLIISQGQQAQDDGDGSRTPYPSPYRFQVVPQNGPTRHPTPWLLNNAPTPRPTTRPSKRPSPRPTTPAPTPWQAHSEHGTIRPSRYPTISSAPTPFHFNPKYAQLRPTPFPTAGPGETAPPTLTIQQL